MSLVLNGSSQYAWRAAPVANVAPFTVFAWYKTTSDAALQAIWGESQQASTAQYWRLSAAGSIAGDPIRGDIRGGGTAATPQTTIGYTINTWQNALLLETSSSDHKVYINGGSVGSSTTDQTPTGEDKMGVGILPYNSSWANYFAGKLAHVAIWDIALSAPDIASLAAGANPLAIQAAHLIAYWPLYNDANDDGGDGLNLALVGSPTFDTGDVPPVDAPPSPSNPVHLTAGIPTPTALENLPTPLEQHGMAECGGLLYVAGGITTGDVHSAKFYCFNPSTGHWSTLEDIPLAVQSAVFKSVNGKLYYIGGYDAYLPLKYDTVYEFNPSTGHWTLKSGHMPYAREDAGAAVIDGKIYVFGGLTNPVHTMVPYVDVYDPVADTWASSRAWAAPRALGDFCVAHNGKIYVISSTPDMGGYSADLRADTQVFEYDPALNTFTPLSPCVEAVCYKEIDDMEGILYMVGGATLSTTTYTGRLQIYDHGLGTWRSIPNFSYAARGFAQCVYNGVLYFCGGYNAGGQLDDFYSYTPPADTSIGIGTLTKSAPPSPGGGRYSAFNLQLNQDRS